jgi:hypothetical protein
MTPNLTAIRSIASEFAFRIYLPVTIFLAIVSFAVVGLMIWLITMSLWWLLLAIPTFLAIIVGGAVLLIGYVILKVIKPVQNKAQTKLVKDFVDKIQRLSEITQTPKVILLFRVIRDAVAVKKSGYIQSVIDDTATLQKDYREIVTAFS